MKQCIGFMVAFLCLGAAIHSSNARELTLDDIFPTDRVLDVQITVAQKDWDTIRHQTRHFAEVLNASRQFKPPDHPYTYVEASVSIDGVVFPKVGIRKKGFIGSQNSMRPSLKIRLNHVDKDAEIEGMTNLTFNNNQQDVSQVSQFMGYALFNAVGSTAPRCAYAKVTVNGRNLGIYSHVESMRKPILKRAFGNNKGPFYEGTVVDFYEEWENSFEHKRGNDTRGREKIKILIDVLADEKVTEAAIGEHVDLDSFYPFWAVEGLLGFWDGYSGNNNNFFIYLNPETDKFHFLPWGADSLFVKHSEIDFRRDPRTPVSVKTQGFIAYRLYQLESGRERYRKAMMALLENNWDEAHLLAEVDRIAAMIQPHMIPAQQFFGGGRDRRRQTPRDFEGMLERTRNFIRTRKGEILAEIDDGMPIWKKRPHRPFVIGPEGFDGKAMRQFIELPKDNLWGAALTGDLEEIKRYLAEGADINELSPETQMSPLTWATLMGQPKAAELLLQRGANVNVRHEDGGTPLHVAVFLGRTEITELLIKNGADVNAKNRDGDVPASGLWAPWEMTKFVIGMFGIKLEQKQVEAGRNKIAKMLGVDRAQWRGMERAWEAAYSGNIKAVEKALADGMDVNARHPESGDLLLPGVALMGHTNIVTLMLKKGADINGQNRDGVTALITAAFLGRAETVEVLLKHGADPNIRNNDGSAPMDVAKLDWGTTQFILGILQIEVDRAKVEAGRLQVVKLLSEHASNSMQSQNLWKAAAAGDLTAIKKALDEGKKINALEPQSGITPLGWAALNGKTEAAKLLIEKGADVNARNKDGATPLHAAAFLGHLEVAKLLIEKGADINAQNNDGSTPIAVTQVDWSLTQFVIGLLQLKADEAEVKAGREKVLKLLLEKQ